MIIALRPPALQLAAGLAAFAVVTGGAAAWPTDDGRPGDGAIADAGDDPARAMAFLGDTLYTLHGSRLYAQPAPDRDYDAAGVWSSEWTPDDPLFDEFEPTGLAFAGDTAYASLGRIGRLVTVTPDGEHRTLVARPRERREPAIPAGAEEVDDFLAGPIAAGPDGSVYILQGDSVARWRAGELTTLAPRFGAARDIATDARGAVYVADTGNGRVHRIDPDGGVRTLVGTEAERRCVSRGLDDPLALDPRRCTAVKALAVDRAGQRLHGAPERRHDRGADAGRRDARRGGHGPEGVRRRRRPRPARAARPGRAARRRPDGDLYVSEAERVRRIADPAGILASDPPEPERPSEPPAACNEIVALTEAAAGIVDGRRARGGHQRARRRAAGRDQRRRRPHRGQRHRPASRPVRDPGHHAARRGRREPRASMPRTSAGWWPAYDVPIDEANEFCLAYGRYRDQGDLVVAGDEPPDAFEAVVDAAPDLLADAGRETLRELDRAAGRVVPEARTPAGARRRGRDRDGRLRDVR